jgi:beta-carotene 3-hydroxylase
MLEALVLCASFGGMEVFTALFHRFIMHGLLWRIHVTHHVRKGRGPFEMNDVFVGFFTVAAICLIIVGLPDGVSVWIGAGIAFYGMTYFVIHDIVIHKRFARPPAPKNAYLQAIYRAHMAHHKHTDNATGEAYGLLWVPSSYWIRS